MKMDNKKGQIKTYFTEKGHTHVNFRERTQKCLFSETNVYFHIEVIEWIINVYFHTHRIRLTFKQDMTHTQCCCSQ